MADHPFTRNGEKRDPTTNVFELVEAANERQDDLREANSKWLDAEIKHLQDMAILRDVHAKEIRELESKRLDANRQFDQLSVRTESERAATAITTLAANAAATAETLRAMVTSTAATIAKQTADTFTAVTERIGKLEISSGEGRGKALGPDPVLEKLAQKLDELSRLESRDTGKSQGMSAMWAFLGSGVMLVVGLLAIYAALK